MQEAKRFLSLEDRFKDGVKKMFPFLEGEEFEVQYRRGLECPECHEKQAEAFYYRIDGDDQWIPAMKWLKCPRCDDRKLFENYHKESIEALNGSVVSRLINDYFQLPDSLKDAGFRNFEDTHKTTTAAKVKATNYAKDFLAGDRYSLMVMGFTGCGKSHLSAAIARTVKEKGFSVGYLTTGKLLSMIKASFDKDDVKRGAAKSEGEIFKDLRKMDLLILDDLGSESTGKTNDWRQSTLFEIVESRSGRPTIYTSNLTDHDLVAAVGGRVHSRLLDNTKSIDMFIENYDYRKTLQRK